MEVPTGLLEFNSSFPTFTSLRAFIQFILYYFLSIKLLSDISVYVRSIRFSSVLISETEVRLFFHSLQILSVLLISQMYLARELGTAATVLPCWMGVHVVLTPYEKAALLRSHAIAG